MVAWRNLDVVFFLSATGALSILFTLCRMGGEEADLSEIAPQFGVSRTHIRNILRAAKERGFIGHHGERRQFIRLMPAWITAFNRFMADSQAYSDLTYRLGLAALADHDAPLPA